MGAWAWASFRGLQYPQRTAAILRQTRHARILQLVIDNVYRMQYLSSYYFDSEFHVCRRIDLSVDAWMFVAILPDIQYDIIYY